MKIVGCKNNQTVICKGNSAGGFVGACKNDTTIENSTNTGEIRSEKYAGEFVGRCNKDVTIRFKEDKGICNVKKLVGVAKKIVVDGNVIKER